MDCNFGPSKITDGAAILDRPKLWFVTVNLNRPKLRLGTVILDSQKKSRIRKTLNLLTNAVKAPIQFFFFRSKKIIFLRKSKNNFLEEVQKTYIYIYMG